MRSVLLSCVTSALFALSATTSAVAQEPGSITLQLVEMRRSPLERDTLVDTYLIVPGTVPCAAPSAKAGRLCASGWDLAAVGLIVPGDALPAGISAKVGIRIVNVGRDSSPQAPVELSAANTPIRASGVVPALGPLDTALVTVRIEVPNGGEPLPLLAVVDRENMSSAVKAENNAIQRSVPTERVTADQILFSAEYPEVITVGKTVEVPFTLRHSNRVGVLSGHLETNAESTSDPGCNSPRERLKLPDIGPGMTAVMVVRYAMSPKCPRIVSDRPSFWVLGQALLFRSLSDPFATPAYNGMQWISSGSGGKRFLRQ